MLVVLVVVARGEKSSMARIQMRTHQVRVQVPVFPVAMPVFLASVSLPIHRTRIRTKASIYIYIYRR